MQNCTSCEKRLGVFTPAVFRVIDDEVSDQYTGESFCTAHAWLIDGWMTTEAVNDGYEYRIKWREVQA